MYLFSVYTRCIVVILALPNKGTPEPLWHMMPWPGHLGQPGKSFNCVPDKSGVAKNPRLPSGRLGDRPIVVSARHM